MQNYVVLDTGDHTVQNAGKRTNYHWEGKAAQTWGPRGGTLIEHPSLQPQEAPMRPPRRPQEASKRPQEAPKRPPRSLRTTGVPLETTCGMSSVCLRWDLPEAAWRPLGGRFGASWGLFGVSWRPLGASSERLGDLWGLLGPSWWERFEMSVRIRPLGPLLGLSSAVLGPSWAVLGLSWGPHGPSWDDLGGPFGRLGRCQDEKSKYATNIRFS